ncbi:MAG: hypothetical protein HY811_10250 [Planctomycetes bacterium]|nr:hypothetical protein [Planctomycetota bacterium]
MKYFFLILLSTYLLFAIGCQEIRPGMLTEELRIMKGWERPKETMKIRYTKYEIWLYVNNYIDNIVFIKGEKVIERRKYSPSDNIWETVREWVLFAERDPIYRRNIDEKVENIINEKLVLTMKPVEVKMAWGVPVSTKTDLSKYGSTEEWTYQRSPYQTTKVVFTNGILTEISEE